MSNAEHDDRSRRARRRKQAIVGLVGLAAALGGGAFLVSGPASDDAATVAADAEAPTPIVPSAAAPEGSPGGSVSPSAAATTPTTPAAGPSRSPASTPAGKSRAQLLDEAKGTAAKADNVRRPLAPQGAAAALSDADVTVTQSGSLVKGGTLKVVSARADLTGQRELSIVADDGRAVGEARCTQYVRFSEGAPAIEKPTMMICWRTSADRSVYTVAVVKSGRPSADASVAALNRRWAMLG
jgi:hypothetical protein